MRILWLLPLLTITGCADSIEDSQPHPEPARSAELTVPFAQALIPKAASLSRKEFDELLINPPIRLRDIKNQSLTALLLAVDPHFAQLQNPLAQKQFRYLDRQADPSREQLIAAVLGDDRAAFASIIRPEYVTKCTCNCRGDIAEGRVTFRAGDLYAGSADYIAQRRENQWRIVEFHLSEYRLTTERQADKTWSLVSEDTLLGINRP